MAISTETMACRYEGHGAEPYEIPFPFHDPAQIFVAIQAEGEEEPAVISPSAFSVTRFDNGLGELVTDAEYPSTTDVIIFRQLPFVQPSVFPPAGPFPAKANETALDRTVMLLQQLNRRVNQLEGAEDGDYVRVPSGGMEWKGLRVWADAAARAETAPHYLGQLGVQTADWSLWVARGLGANLWERFGEQQREWRVFEPGVPVVSDEARFVGTLSRAMFAGRVIFSVAEPAEGATEFTLFAGAYEIASATLATGETQVSAASEIDEAIPAGTQITIAIDGPSFGYVDGARGLDVVIEGRLVLA